MREADYLARPLGALISARVCTPSHAGGRRSRPAPGRRCAPALSLGSRHTLHSHGPMIRAVTTTAATPIRLSNVACSSPAPQEAIPRDDHSHAGYDAEPLNDAALAQGLTTVHAGRWPTSNYAPARRPFARSTRHPAREQHGTNQAALRRLESAAEQISRRPFGRAASWPSHLAGPRSAGLHPSDSPPAMRPSRPFSLPPARE